MKRTCLFPFFAVLLWCLSGCETPQEAAPAVDALGGLKITDIRDTSQDLERADFLIRFRVMQYALDPNNLDMLEPLYDSSDAVAYQNRHAFEANGFAVAVMPRQESSRIARALNSAGAARSGIASISVPPETTEILSTTSVYQLQQIRYYAEADNLVTESVYPGFLGWTLFAEDLAQRDVIALKLSPAYWQTGAEDMRIRMGKEPINFNLLEFASFQLRLNVGDLVLLAPRSPAEPATLKQALFTEWGKKPLARCFVLVCESAGL